MTIDDLLIRRVRIAIPFPNMNPFKVGDILMEETHIFQGKTFSMWGYEGLERNKRIEKSEIETCKDIFVPLEWYSHRELSDLPEYVKCTDECDLSGNIYEVIRWGYDCVEIDDENISNILFEDEGELMILPATLTEYEAYKNSKQ